MEELTIEQKAKAYDEALNRAKLLKYNPKKVLFECENIPVSDYIFPELEESEDERIRKALIKYFTVYTSYSELTDGVTAGDSVAWLEKQGEQKPLEEGTFINVDEVREGFMQEVYRVLDADPNNDRANQIIDAFDNLSTTSIQKTSEWSDEDENEYNHILKILNLVAEEQETKGYNNLISSVNWLKSLKRRIKE